MELSELLRNIGGGIAAGPAVAKSSGDRRVLAVAAKEGSAVLLVPAPVSSVAAVVHTTFPAWATQVKAYGASI